MKDRGYNPQEERLAMLEFGNVHDVDVLDIGAGRGELAIIAAGKMGCRVTCIDPDPAKLARAAGWISQAGLSERVTFEAGDARWLDFPDGHFTCALCYSVLHHVVREDREAVVAELARVAREKVIFSELTLEGATFFDEVLHPGESHVSNLVAEDWLASRVAGLGRVDIGERRYTYFVMLVK
ncbi:MAG: class I SAM-dependent methyltransferase [Candidatus Lokiarchaeota archaeon]|nr:class I SAM-dependent methyltransferase [Candidatus Lokiarchaeota archaeon]